MIRFYSKQIAYTPTEVGAVDVFLALKQHKQNCFSTSILWLFDTPAYHYKATSIQMAHNEQRHIERQFLPMEYLGLFCVRESVESFLNQHSETLEGWVSRALLSQGDRFLLATKYAHSDGSEFSHCIAIKKTESGWHVFDIAFTNCLFVCCQTQDALQKTLCEIIRITQDSGCALTLLSRVDYARSECLA